MLLTTSTAKLLFLATAFLARISFGNAEDVFYEWTIKPRLSVPPLSPDCYTGRDLLLVNGEPMPGPEIRANVGDTVHIKWINMSPSEAVSIHYHGNLMQNQPYADGTGGISTCNVGPMQTFEHTFVADNAGTHYWHGHTSLDRMDGLQGLIIIEDPDDPEEQALKDLYDEERVIFLQDWYHKSGPGLRTSLDSGVWIGLPNSLLINGKGRFSDCAADENRTLPFCDEGGCSAENYTATIQVEADKTYLFRIINAGALVSLNFAIANHTMTVVRADGTYVNPFDVTSLEVNLAQRYSVLVNTDQDPDMSYLAAAQTRGLKQFAYLQYGNSTLPDMNSTMPTHLEDGPAIDAMLFSKSVAGHPDPDLLGTEIVPDRSSVIITAQGFHPPSGVVKYTSNNVSNSLYSPKPLVVLAYEATMMEDAAPWPDTEIEGTVLVPDTAPFTWNFSNTPRDEGVNNVHMQHGLAVFKFVKGEVVDMVFQNTVGGRGSAGSHAWHLHGHEMYIIGQGAGIFDSETDPATFNFDNPVLRDTFSVWDLGWTAIRFRANNPGVWPFHCTMAPHAVTGMGFNVITSPDMLSAPPPGLTSCYQTSVDPDDAQVCTLASDMEPDSEANATDLDDGVNSTGVDISKNGPEDEKEGDSGATKAESAAARAGHTLAFLVLAVHLCGKTVKAAIN